MTHDYDDLISRTRADLAAADCPDLAEAEKRLLSLRNYREHALMAALAEKYLGHWPQRARIMKFHAQALIETGHVQAARHYLGAALDAAKGDTPEQIEVLALMGRAEKELAQKALARGSKDIAVTHFQRSFDAYSKAHGLDPKNAYYPLINAAAIADLARSHSIKLAGNPDPFGIAHEVLEILDRDTSGARWVEATYAEAQIALGDWDAVEARLKTYLSETLLPFEHASTLRQFRDLWRLGTRDPRGAAILAMMQAKCMWDNRQSTTDVPADISIEDASTLDLSEVDAEAMLGEEGKKSFAWLMEGVESAARVASVLNRSRRRIGTCFVVDADDFGLGKQARGKTCLMTNFHVLSEEGEGSAISASDGGQVCFEAASTDAERKKRHKIRKILFQSPFRGGLDCTIFTIDAKAGTFDPIPVAPEPDDLPGVDEQPTPRVYLIGYPLGGEMHFSLQDNRLLDHECRPGLTPDIETRRRVHYFAPTEPGNSGSPVFDANWQCIALHHGGRKLDPEANKNGIPRLNGQGGRYSANQGIWIGSIVRAALASD